MIKNIVKFENCKMILTLSACTRVNVYTNGTAVHVYKHLKTVLQKSQKLEICKINKEKMTEKSSKLSQIRY